MSVDDDIENCNFVGALLKGKQKFEATRLVLDKSLILDDSLNFDKTDTDNDVSNLQNLDDSSNKPNGEVIDLEIIEDTPIFQNLRKKSLVRLDYVVPVSHMRATRSRTKAIQRNEKLSPVVSAKNRRKRKPNKESNAKSKKTRGKNSTRIDLDDPVPTIGLLLSSDDDFDVQVVESEEEDVNYEQRVLVKWNCGEIHRLSLRRFQKFTFIQDYFAKIEQCSPENVYIKLDDKYIQPNESIDSIKLSVKDILDASVKTYMQPITIATTDNSNKLSFKIQYKNCKQPIHVSVNSTDKMKVLMEKVREELAKPLSALFFEFDGEKLDGNKTAAAQDMFGGEIIDLRIKE